MTPNKRHVAPPIALASVVFLLWSEPAAAYIDPGTGSALFYLIAGILVSVYFGIRSFYYRLLDIVFRIRYRDQSCELAIHCEDPRYEITFLPIIKELSRYGLSTTFFTMYERDPSFEPLPQGVAHRAIAPGLLGYAYLNNVDAKLLVTTTPQLDVMTFRRSRRVQHYVIVQHALGESRYVRPYAYDYFDTVMCCGPILESNIRRMESLRAARPKQLLRTGLPHYEELLKSVRSRPAPHGRAVVLVAPSWGPLSMFERFGPTFLEPLAQHFTVIVRPHPQMRVSQPELYAKILAVSGVECDTQRTPAEAMSRADALLSDISGIAHEFAFIYERPVVVLDQHVELGGLEGELLGGESELKARCAEFIVPVPAAEISRIHVHLSNALERHSPERIRAIRQELVYNFGQASQVAAHQLIDTYRSLRGAIEPQVVRPPSVNVAEQSSG